MSAMRSPCPTTSPRIFEGSAPRAMRRPISAVRWLTVYDITPYGPTAESASASPANRIMSSIARRQPAMSASALCRTSSTAAAGFLQCFVYVALARSEHQRETEQQRGNSTHKQSESDHWSIEARVGKPRDLRHQRVLQKPQSPLREHQPQSDSAQRQYAAHEEQLTPSLPLLAPNAR
jgi:hypothetical protein